jgi:hypothetical protein
MARQGITQFEILSGWKEIANYLGGGVRTVQRYECELGLPIRRPAGRSRGSVIATKAEIDAWISASPLREAFRLSLHAMDSTETVKGLKTASHGVAPTARGNRTIARRNERFAKSTQGVDTPATGKSCPHNRRPTVIFETSDGRRTDLCSTEKSELILACTKLLIA